MMTAVPEILFKKVCYIFHRGFMEARKLARLKNDEQAHDLADTFEVMPGWLAEWNAETLEMMRANLACYQSKYGQLSFDYIAILEMDDDAFMETFARY